MDRRESFKTILVGGLTGGLALLGCRPVAPDVVENRAEVTRDYGRTVEEKSRDVRLMNTVFFTEHEAATLAILCDLLLPASPSAGSATEAGVPDFLEFIVKDIPAHQVPLRGGLMWLDHFAMKSYHKDFISCSDSEHRALLDQIAYPTRAKPEHAQGVEFFSLIRNLILTGYYTSQMGIQDLGYQGNVPNVWDGVPDEVLAKHGLAYDQEWLDKCIDQTKRETIARWDDEGRLI